MDALYRVHDVEKLGLAHFPPVAALVRAPNLALLSKDTACPYKQCWVSEVILKRAYSAGAFATQLGPLLAYQTYLLQSLSMNHRPSPQQLDELRLVNKNLLRVSKLNGQAVGTNLAVLVTTHRQLWLSQRPPPVQKPAANCWLHLLPEAIFGTGLRLLAAEAIISLRQKAKPQVKQQS
ncbi:UNVERIFIED_CONTAM: hypothetical protein FKN15_030055 [Acipenser sinensis]